MAFSALGPVAISIAQDGTPLPSCTAQDNANIVRIGAMFMSELKLAQANSTYDKLQEFFWSALAPMYPPCDKAIEIKEQYGRTVDEMLITYLYRRLGDQRYVDNHTRALNWIVNGTPESPCKFNDQLEMVCATPMP